MFRNRYFQIIREEQSGAYGVNVNTNYSIFPKLSEILSINFQTDPAKAPSLRAIALQELQRSYATPFSPYELRQIVIFLKKEKEMKETEKGIGYWMNVLNYYIEFNIDLPPNHFKNIINTITPEAMYRNSSKIPGKRISS